MQRKKASGGLVEVAQIGHVDAAPHLFARARTVCLEYHGGSGGRRVVMI